MIMDFDKKILGDLGDNSRTAWGEGTSNGPTQGLNHAFIAIIFTIIHTQIVG